MATNQPLPDREPPPGVAEFASHQTAGALRRNRLTLLCSQAGAGSPALLIDGVLPQLRRRGGDAAVSVAKRPLDTITPFPDRRARDPSMLAELAILVSDWGTPSQASLHNGIDAALRAASVDPEWYREPLTERVQSLSSRFGTRFLFILDGFETVLESKTEPEARADLLGELVHLLNSPVPANLLIALRTDAEPLLAPLLERLRSVRAEVLMLEGGRIRRVYGPATAAPAPPAAAPAPQTPTAPQPALKPKPTQLAQFDSARMQEAANTGAPTRPGAFGPVMRERERERQLLAAPALTTPPQPPPPRRFTTRRIAAIASVAIASVAIGAIAGGAWLFRAGLPSSENPTTAAPAETIAAALPAAPVAPVVPVAPVAPVVPVAPTPKPPEAALPAPTPTPPTSTPTPTITPTQSQSPPPPATSPRLSLALRVDADNAGTRLARELAQALSANGGADLQIVPTPLALPAATGRAGAPGLAVVRYDALQAAARSGAKPDLAVVAPLYTEELQIAVRADSPLKFIHQLEGQRINVGAAEGARAVTARALYRQMFDRPLPVAKQGTLDAAPALQQLLAGGSLDAVVLVGPQPAAALAALPPAQRRGVKMLALAPDNTASRRALQTYLPATLRDPAGGTTPSLAAMSFLVTTGTPDANTAKTLGQLATSLCRQLPELQRAGDAKWRALSAGLQLETGWPHAGAAEAAWRACAGGVGVSSAAPAATDSPSPPHRN